MEPYSLTNTLYEPADMKYCKDMFLYHLTDLQHINLTL